MKIEGVMIRDKEKGFFFAFVRQFPGVCAQGRTFEEADRKVNTYYQAFIERIKNEKIEMEETAFPG